MSATSEDKDYFIEQDRRDGNWSIVGPYNELLVDEVPSRPVAEAFLAMLNGASLPGSGLPEDWEVVNAGTDPLAGFSPHYFEMKIRFPDGIAQDIIIDPKAIEEYFPGRIRSIMGVESPGPAPEASPSPIPS